MEKRAFLFEKWLLQGNKTKWTKWRKLLRLLYSKDKRNGKTFDPDAELFATPAATYDTKTGKYTNDVLKLLGIGAGIGGGTGALTSIASGAINNGEVKGDDVLKALGFGASLGAVAPFAGGEIGAGLNRLTLNRFRGKPSDIALVHNVKNIGTDMAIGGGYNAGALTAPVLSGLFAGMNPNMLADAVKKTDKASRV